MAEELGESRNQIQRYIRLTELAPELQEMVDNKKIAFTPAVELSYLSESEQQLLLDAMDSEQATLSLSQAQRLKQFSQRGELTAEVMRAIMSEEKKPEIDGRILKLDLPELRELLSLMRRYCGNLNQIAKRVNSTHRIYAVDLEDIQTSQAKLWQSVRDLVLSLAKLK